MVTSINKYFPSQLGALLKGCFDASLGSMASVNKVTCILYPTIVNHYEMLKTIHLKLSLDALRHNLSRRGSLLKARVSNAWDNVFL